MSKFDPVEAFTAAVKAAGGLSLDEEIFRPTFRNADYFFPVDRVLIELKCLSKNGMTDDGYRDWLSRQYMGWVRRGLAPPPARERFVVNLPELPRACYLDVVEKLAKKVESNFLRKANQQIRDSRVHLGLPGAHGILAIANDGDHSLPPGMLKRALGRLLQTKYPCIDGIWHFSTNEAVSVPSMDTSAAFWIQWGIPGRRPPPAEFAMRVQDAWLREHQRRTGAEGAPVLVGSAENISEMTFVATPLPDGRRNRSGN